VEHCKDGEAGAVIRSRLEPVEIGKDVRDDPITTCLIVPADDEAATAKTKNVTGKTKVALDLLRELIADTGEVVTSNHIPPNTMSVDVELWRKYFYNGSITPDTKSDSQRKAFDRASDKLQDLGIIGVWGTRVWLVQPRPDIRTF
jgi:hypothetical protein